MNQLRQRLLTWSEHVASWLDQRDLPVHLLRYEDLSRDPGFTFQAAMAFAGRVVTDPDAARAVRLANFNTLQIQERAHGFKEWQSRGNTLFFRRGEADGWRDELTPGKSNGSSTTTGR